MQMNIEYPKNREERRLKLKAAKVRHASRVNNRNKIKGNG